MENFVFCAVNVPIDWSEDHRLYINLLSIFFFGNILIAKENLSVDLNPVCIIEFLMIWSIALPVCLITHVGLLIQFVIFNPWKVTWNWIAFYQNSFVISPGCHISSLGPTVDDLQTRPLHQILLVLRNNSLTFWKLQTDLLESSQNET